jgi:hypothetical protein
MAKNTYQTYTEETPIMGYRADFIRRSAMCAALVQSYPDLGPVAAEANTILGQIDARRADLQQAEDDQVRARAIEDVEKLVLLEVYTEARRTMAVKSNNVLKVLPDAPSTLERLGAKKFDERMKVAIANLKKLPDGDPIKAAFLAKLEKEAGDFATADTAEDTTRNALHGERVALLLYKSELSQVREMQLGTIQKVFGDREKSAQFTLPWRKSGKGEGDEEAERIAAPPPAVPPAP